MTTAIFYGIVLFIVLLDQAVKAWVKGAIPVGGTIPLWPGVFHLTHTQNEGMAFSLLQGQRWFLSAAALIVVIAIALAQRRLSDGEVNVFSLRPTAWQTAKHFARSKMSVVLGLAFALPMGGAIGNLTDRLFQGYVTDLFDFTLINFPVFNVADSAITVGIGLLIWHTLTTKEEEPPKSAVSAAPTET